MISILIVMLLIYYGFLTRKIEILSKNFYLAIFIVTILSIISLIAFFKTDENNNVVLKNKIIIIKNIALFIIAGIAIEFLGIFNIVIFAAIILLVIISMAILKVVYSYYKVINKYSKIVIPLFELEDYDKAEIELKKLNNIKKFDFIYHNLALVAFRKGEIRSSLEYLENISSKYNSDVVNSFKTELFFLIGEYDLAEKTYDDIKEIELKKESLIIKAIIAAIKESSNNSAKIFSEYNKNKPSYHTLKELYNKRGFTIKEIEFNSEKNYFEGLYYFYNNNYETAKIYFNNVIKCRVNNFYNSDSKLKLLLIEDIIK